MKIYYLILLLLSSIIVSGQIRPNTIIPKGNNIYAIIFGVSDYKEESIGDLKYAHRDAELFAKFLSTKEGGSVPDENILIYTNKNATFSNYQIAEQWLYSKAKEGDLVYVFFSGHGMTENRLYQKGYLLAHDSPKTSMLHSSIRISDLNDMANVLSVINGSRVIIITDACRSGALVGTDNRGTQLVGEQLSKVQNNEIRIASCKPTQVSFENYTWGNGMGAMTYYLINGLLGNADMPVGNQSKDGKVTLSELQYYLTNVVKNDVFQRKDSLQIPVFHGGSAEQILSYATDNDKSSFFESFKMDFDSQTKDNTKGINNISYSARQDQLYLELLSEENLKDNEDFKIIANKTRDEIVQHFIKKYKFKNHKSFKDGKYLETVKKNTNEGLDYNLIIASAIHNQVQLILNSYLSDDNEEIRRRSNNAPSYYEEYIYMIETALKLVDVNVNFHKALSIKKHYFKGLHTRLNSYILDENPKLDTIDFCISEQKKALKYEDTAPYVNNELGLLHLLKRDTFLAHVYFQKAIRESPDWALPINNVSKLYGDKKLDQESYNMAALAVEKSPNYLLALNQMGNIALKCNDILTAEDAYIKAYNINQNILHTNRGLGYTYLSQLNYEKANEYFIRAYSIYYSRLLSIPNIDTNTIEHKSINRILSITNAPSTYTTHFYQNQKEIPLASIPTNTKLDPNLINENDILGLLYLSRISIDNHNHADAIKYLNKMIDIRHDDPLANYYKGITQFNNQNYIAAEQSFIKASDNMCTAEKLERYVSQINTNSKEKDYLASFYLDSQFTKTDLYKYLATLYLHLGKIGKALTVVNKAIDLSPEDVDLYVLLSNIYYSQSNYDYAEYSLTKIRNFNPQESTKLLIEFHQNQINLQIDPINNACKLGKLYADLLDYEVDYRDPTLVVDSMYFAYIVDIEDQVNNDKKSDYYSNLYRIYAANNDDENVNAVLDKILALPKFDTDYLSIYIDNLIDNESQLTAYNALLKWDGKVFFDYDLLSVFARLASLKGDYTKHKSLINRLIEINGMTDQILRLQAFNYILQGESDKAIPIYELLAAKHPRDISINYTLLRIYTKNNKIDKAIELLKDQNQNWFNISFVFLYDSYLEPVTQNDTYNKIINE